MSDSKFIVWDWNGTILDDTVCVLEAINVVLSKANVAPVSLEKLRATHGKSFEGFYENLGVPHDKQQDILAIATDLFHDSYEARSGLAPLRHGAVALLGTLKAHSVTNTLLSNHIGCEIERLLKQHGIANVFDRIMAYATRQLQFIGPSKRERLSAYISEKGFDPANAFMIGDSREELEIAHEFGMGSIALTGGMTSEENLRSVNPDHVAHSFEDIGLIFEKEGVLA